jgi:hypothetical protein
MSDDFTDSAQSKQIDQQEHNHDAGAKRVIQRVQGTDGEWVNGPAPFLDAAYDDVEFTNPDGNGNYQTLTFNNGGTPVRTLTMSFDGSSNVTSIVRT